MRKNNVILFLVLAFSMIVGDSLKAENQPLEMKKMLLMQAFKSGQYVTIKHLSVKFQENVKILKMEGDYVTLSGNAPGTESDRSISMIEYVVFKLNPGVKIALPFKYGWRKMEITGTVRGVKDTLVLITPDQKYELKLIDKSVMQGEITAVDCMKNEIVFTTKITSYTLAQDKIDDIKMVDSSVEVRLVLIDGTQRNGRLIKDDGRVIVVRTILGEETYPRDKVLKIEYKK